MVVFILRVDIAEIMCLDLGQAWKFLLQPEVSEFGWGPENDPLGSESFNV